MNTDSKPGGDKKQKAVADEPDNQAVVSGAVAGSGPGAFGKKLLRPPLGSITARQKLAWYGPRAGAMLLVVMLAAAVSVHQSNKQVSVCSDNLIGTASHAIDKGDSVTLGKYQTQILQKKKYDKDPNCVYILLRTALLSKDVSDSQKYLGELQKLSDANAAHLTYSKAFTTRVFSLQESSEIVSYLQQSEKQKVDSLRKKQAAIDKSDQEADKLVREAQQ